MSTGYRWGRRRAPRHGRTVGRVLAVVVVATLVTTTHAGALDDPIVDRTLDGSRNNLQHPTWGQANIQYRRNAAARYADGRSVPVSGPEARFISNRIFNDRN